MKRTLNSLATTVFFLISISVASGQDCTLEWERSDDVSPIAQGRLFTLDANENSYMAYYGSIGLGILKSDSDGSVIWDVEREESAHAIRDISVDADGNIFLSGYTYSFSNGQAHGQGIWLMKFDGNGSFQWKTLELGYMGPINQYPPLCKHRVDANGDIYVVGSSLNATIDYKILKYDTSGALLWQRSAGEPLNVDFPVAMDLSPDGRLAVTGGGFATMVPGPTTVSRSSSTAASETTVATVAVQVISTISLPPTSRRMRARSPADLSSTRLLRTMFMSR